MVKTAYIALGSNLGNRHVTIRSALAMLDSQADLKVVAVSELLETEPVGPGGQGAYINAAACLHTSLGPRELLQRCLEIERMHGRERRPEHRWEARTLDLDLLLYEGVVLDEPGLTLPHPCMAERDFVLRPLAQIAPDLLHPALGLTIQCLLDRLGGGGNTSAVGGVSATSIPA